MPLRGDRPIPPPNPPFQLTPLRGLDVAAILKIRSGLNAFPIS